MEAVALSAPSQPGLRLTLVGDGPTRPEIEGLIKAKGLSGAVELAGWRDEAGVQAALAKAQALILPSFAEGLPMVVMEAMAAGRPVIATAIAGVPELVVAGETGWLVPAGDPLALAEAIAALARTPQDKLTAMGKAARDRVFERHDIDVEAAKLAALIAQSAKG
jgi:glycosyltransferase involved in cell wall biosynthesis